MNKKLLVFSLVCVLSLALSACGSDSQNAGKVSNEEEISVSESTEQVVSIDFDGTNLVDTGDGIFNLCGSSGSTADGAEVVIFNAGDLLLEQLEIDTEGFDGSHLSFVYVDGMLNDKIQLSDSQATFNLTENELEEGEHSVEIVQYDNDDEGGNVILYKKQCYTVKLA